MPVSVIVGGQFGSEGKGKASLFFAKEMNVAAAVRVGGPNSGHTAIDGSGVRHIFRHLPTAALLESVTCILPAGSYIVPELLFRELSESRLEPKRLLIDPNAMVISPEDVAGERKIHLNELIGSTGSGTGAALIRRISRHHSVSLAKDDSRLSRFVSPTIPYLRDLLDRKKRILIEGTQGFGLSLLHSPHYPYATSRDTSAAGFVSETGLSPLDIDDVILVIRTFPIRVAGNSGPLKNEISWEQVSTFGGSDHPIIEYTSVTQRVRRVAQFDPVVVAAAIQSNKPTRILLNHVDYVDSHTKNSLTARALEFIEAIESQIGAKIDYVGLSPSEVVKISAKKTGLAQSMEETNHGIVRDDT